MNHETLRPWVRWAENDSLDRPGITSDERARINAGRRQRLKQRLFFDEAQVRNRSDLGVFTRIVLDTPHPTGVVRHGQVVTVAQDQVTFGVDDEMLDEAFGFRVGWVAEVR